MVQEAMVASVQAGVQAMVVVSIFMASVEPAAQQQALQQAGEEVLVLEEPFSFKEEVFSSLKTASVFPATRRLPALAARQPAVVEEMDPLLGKISLSAREAVSPSRSTAH
jgi:hypothetical protein